MNQIRVQTASNLVIKAANSEYLHSRNGEKINLSI